MANKARNIIVTFQCFVHKDGRYLMLHRNPTKRIMPDIWMAPGGKIEQNEGLFTAARREIWEETGLKIKNLMIKAAGNAYLQDLDQEVFLHLIFAEYASGEVKDNPEDGELVWLTAEEIAKLPNLLAEIKEIHYHLFHKNDIISYTAVYEQGNKLSSFLRENN